MTCSPDSIQIGAQCWDQWDGLMIGAMLGLLLACLTYAIVVWRADVRKRRLEAESTDKLMKLGFQEAVRRGWLSRDMK